MKRNTNPPVRPTGPRPPTPPGPIVVHPGDPPPPIIVHPPVRDPPPPPPETHPHPESGSGADTPVSQNSSDEQMRRFSSIPSPPMSNTAVERIDPRSSRPHPETPPSQRIPRHSLNSAPAPAPAPASSPAPAPVTRPSRSDSDTATATAAPRASGSASSIPEGEEEEPSEEQEQRHSALADTYTWLYDYHLDTIMIFVTICFILLVLYAIFFGHTWGSAGSNAKAGAAADVAAAAATKAFLPWIPCPFQGANKLHIYPDTTTLCVSYKPIDCIQMENQFISRGLCVNGELESVASLQTTVNSCDASKNEEACDKPPESWTKDYSAETAVINALHENILRRRVVHKDKTKGVQSADFVKLELNKHRNILQNASFISVKFVLYPPASSNQTRVAINTYMNYLVTDSNFKTEMLRLPFDKPINLVNRWAFKNTHNKEMKSSEVFVIPTEPKCDDCSHCQLHKALCSIPFGKSCYSINSKRCSVIMREIPARYLTKEKKLEISNIIVSILLCH